MTDYSEDLKQELGVTVIDPISTTFKMVEGLIEAGLCHSKIGLYSTPFIQKIN